MDIMFFSQQFRMGLVEILSHYFYGSEDLVVKKLIKNLKNDFPDINIVGSFSPPMGSYEELARRGVCKRYY